MATTRTNNSTTSKGRPTPQDRLPKAPTAAERARAEATGEDLTFPIDVGGETFDVRHPDYWAPDAADSLLYGSWTQWARTGLVDADGEFTRFMTALRSVTNADLRDVRRDLIERNAVAQGEGLGS